MLIIIRLHKTNNKINRLKLMMISYLVKMIQKRYNL